MSTRPPLGCSVPNMVQRYLGTEYDKVKSVADNIETVTEVADNLDHIKVVENDLVSINTVSSNIDEIVVTSSNIEDVKSVAIDMEHIKVVENNLGIINTVATDIEEVVVVSSNIADVNSVVADMSYIKTVESNLENIVTVADNITDVVTVSDNIDYVKDVAEGIEGLPVSGYIGDTPPTQPKVGATWYCSLDGRNYTWYEDVDSGQWVESSPQSTIETDPSIAHTVVTNTDNIFALWKRSAAEAGLNLVDGSFEEGGVLTSSNDVLLHKNSKNIYAWTGAFPKVVGANSTPATSGGIGAGAWVDRTDLTLRSELSEINGAHLVGGAAFYIADILQADVTNIQDGAIVIAASRNGHSEGGGIFKYSASSSITSDGGIVFTPTTGTGRLIRQGYTAIGFNGKIDFAWYGAVGDGVTDDYVAINTALSAFPKTGGTFLVNKFFAISLGILLKPRCTLEGIGRDSCGFIKTTHNHATVSTRQWQTHTDSYNYDYIIALDVDSDPTGNLGGNQIRGHQIKDLSLTYSTPDKGGYGIYSFYSYETKLSNLQISNVTYGLTSKSWLWEVYSVMVSNAITGFQVTEGTSHTFINCYAKNVSVGYEITNLTYSTFISCACDFASSIAYRLQSVYCTSFISCGSEDSTQRILYILGGNRINFVGFRAIRVTYTPGHNPLYFHDSYVTMTSCHINYTLTSDTPFIGMNDNTLHLINSSIPTGVGSYNKWDIGTLSSVNITDETGNKILLGQSGVFYYCQICNEQYTVYDEYSAPVVPIAFLPTGTRWIKRVPTSGNPYEWIFDGTNWIVTATMP